MSSGDAADFQYVAVPANCKLNRRQAAVAATRRCPPPGGGGYGFWTVLTVLTVLTGLTADVVDGLTRLVLAVNDVNPVNLVNPVRKTNAARRRGKRLNDLTSLELKRTAIGTSMQDRYRVFLGLDPIQKDPVDQKQRA